MSILCGPVPSTVTFTRRLSVGDRVEIAWGADRQQGNIVAASENVGAYTVETTGSAAAAGTQQLRLFRHEINAEHAAAASSCESADGAREAPCMYEAVVGWHPRLAGRPFYLVPNAADQLGLERPFLLEVPDEDSTAGGPIVIHVQLDLRSSPASFTSAIVPAPWVTSQRHWRIGSHWGVAQARAAQLSIGSSVARLPSRQQPTPATSTEPVAEQSADGCVRLLTQSHGGSFLSVMSPHLMLADEHVFAFEILTCARDRATGLRVGVCSEDGRQQWLLRLADGRLCGANGAPLSEQLPPRDTEPFDGRCDFMRRQSRLMRLDNHSPVVLTSESAKARRREGGADGARSLDDDADAAAPGPCGRMRTCEPIIDSAHIPCMLQVCGPLT